MICKNVPMPKLSLSLLVYDTTLYHLYESQPVARLSAPPHKASLVVIAALYSVAGIYAR